MSGSWMPRRRWDALVRGEDCPLCRVAVMQEQTDKYGYTVADFGISRLRLLKNQYVAGYCGLLCRKHVREPYELSLKDCRQFFEDMMRAGQALERVYKADKMNFQILGNEIPHLHCHIIPRYYGDPAPGKPIAPNSVLLELSPAEYQMRIEQIRDSLNINR